MVGIAFALISDKRTRNHTNHTGMEANMKKAKTNLWSTLSLSLLLIAQACGIDNEEFGDASVTVSTHALSATQVAKVKVGLNTWPMVTSVVASPGQIAAMEDDLVDDPDEAGALSAVLMDAVSPPWWSICHQPRTWGSRSHRRGVRKLETRGPGGTMTLANCQCGTTLAIGSQGIGLVNMWRLLRYARKCSKERRISVSRLLEEIRQKIDAQVLVEAAQEDAAPTNRRG